MSGFSDDVLSILRHNLMLHREAIGLLLGIKNDLRVRELMARLDSLNLISTGMLGSSKWCRNFSYIVMPSSCVKTSTLLKALTSLNSGGIIIMEITGKDDKFLDKYKEIAFNMSATKIIYEDRGYMVIHPGVEYGN